MIVTLLFGAFASLVCLPTILLMVECVVGSLARPVHCDDAVACDKDRPSVDVLVPAHNEQSVIAATIASILPQLNPSDRLLVVADNCTDATASVARSMGAEVVERHDEDHRAKGYAVAYGLEILQPESRDVVLMVDADCHVGDDAVDRLVRQAETMGCPAQASYEMPSPVTSDGCNVSAWSAVSSFAVSVKNQVRPIGLDRLGFGCILYGSGMAFPAAVARKPNWASDNIVEDMKVCYDLMVAGHSPRFCPAAMVTASLPENHQNAIEQRKRWEHGHLFTIVTQTPRLIFHATTSLRPSLLVAAIDLMIPPLALLVQIWLVATLVTAVATVLLSLSWWPTGILLLAGMNIALAVLTAWWSHGRNQLSIAQLCSVPFYIVSKLPLYVSAVFRRQRAWRRTERDAAKPRSADAVLNESDVKEGVCV